MFFGVVVGFMFFVCGVVGRRGLLRIRRCWCGVRLGFCRLRLAGLLWFVGGGSRFFICCGDGCFYGFVFR